MGYFIVYMKTVNSKWPIELFATDTKDAAPLISLNEIKQILINDKKIYFRDINKHHKNVRMTLYKSQITSITGPIYIPSEERLVFNQVLTLNEAVDRWKTISNVGTIRKAIFAKRFTPNEVRKSESIWLVTLGGMIRVFGPEDEYDHPSLTVQQLHFNDGDPYWEQIL